LVTSVPDHGGDFICLELLYDRLCALQAAGDEECFALLGTIFFGCLQVYLRPVALWMEQGIILETDEGFFIAVADKGSASSSLWHDRYTLRTTSDGTLHAPRFLYPAAKKILDAGKSIVFLQTLRKDSPTDFRTTAVDLTYHSVCEKGAVATLLPFSELFSTAFSNWIGNKYGPAASILKQHLLDSCSLLRHLESLEYVYFSKDGVVFQMFADELFKRIGDQKGDWNDKFLLSELARTSFGSLANVKAGSLSVRTTRSKQTSRSVKVLSSVFLDINMPWAVQNIVQRSALSTYQGVFCFLLQIYRAKYLLRADSFKLRQPTALASRHAIGIYQQLMWFTNIMHSYVTETVIQTSIEDLRERLKAAEDVDAMCELHERFVARLELATLLATNLAPIHDSIISILDLAVLYSDTQTSDLANDKSASKVPPRHKYRPQRGRRRHSTMPDADEDSLDELSSSESELSDADYASEDDAVSTVNKDKPYAERLEAIHDQCSQLLHFTVAGLRGVSRAGGESAWEMLAERLEWGLHRPSRSTSYD
jgi:gamma-tubulin complex component 5